jgi:hypothetical protein
LWIQNRMPENVSQKHTYLSAATFNGRVPFICFISVPCSACGVTRVVLSEISAIVSGLRLNIYESINDLDSPLHLRDIHSWWILCCLAPLIQSIRGRVDATAPSATSSEPLTDLERMIADNVKLFKAIDWCLIRVSAGLNRCAAPLTLRCIFIGLNIKFEFLGVGWDWVHLVRRLLLAYCTSPGW